MDRKLTIFFERYLATPAEYELRHYDLAAIWGQLADKYYLFTECMYHFTFLIIWWECQQLKLAINAPEHKMAVNNDIAPRKHTCEAYYKHIPSKTSQKLAMYSVLDIFRMIQAVFTLTDNVRFS